MGVFDRQIAQALRQIAAKGEACFWNVASAPLSDDPTTPWIATDTTTPPIPVFILFTSSPNTGYKIKAGSNVEQNISKGIMASVTFTPQLSDTVTRSDGTVLQLDSIDPLKPNGQVIMYYLEFKQ
jgi:hypothetical protein